MWGEQATERHVPLHDRTGRRRGGGIPPSLGPWQDPSPGEQLRRHACDRLCPQVPTAPAEPRHRERTSERPGGERRTPPPGDPVADPSAADDRSAGTTRGLRRSGLSAGGDGLLPTPHLSPSDLATRADEIDGGTQSPCIPDDVGAQRVYGPWLAAILGHHGSTPRIRTPSLV